MHEELNVVLVSQLTLDGRISRAPGASSHDLIERLDPAARIDIHRYRAQCDAIAVGRRTIAIDNPSLTTRHVEGPNPIRIVFAGSGRLRGDETVLTDGGRTVLVIDPDVESQLRPGRLNDAVDVIVGARSASGLRSICAALRRDYAVSTLMLEGGSNLTSSFFAAGLVNQMVLYTVSCLALDASAPTLMSPNGLDHRLEFVSGEQLGSTTKTTYNVLH